LVSPLPPPQEPRGERYITETIARIGAGDALFAIDLARALLKTAGAQGGKPGARAEALLRHLPRSRLDLYSEKFVPHDGIIDILRDIHRSRIDWLFSGDSFALAVEVKTNRRTGFGYRQLDSYHRALTVKGSPIAKPFSGLMALVPIKPFKDKLLSARRRRFFLGAVLWEQAEPALREIRPVAPGDAARWAATLDAVL
jgi:hypothetical protein